ncbi:uncharacterized membrane protein YidH (DUF202 family) [Microbacterium ulmi]|nr:uncharacterized membrane protein YidH (DUF202 family) [Microbacterium ulmi]
MPATPDDDLVESRIAEWRTRLERRTAFDRADAEELEAHLREQMDELRRSGLSDDESFLIAIGRVGSLDDLSREYAREHSDRLWKQLVLGEPESGSVRRRRGVVAVVLAIAAGLALKAPTLFGIGPDGSNGGGPTIFGAGVDSAFYARNGMLLVLPFLGLYFAWRNRPTPAVAASVAGAFALAAVLVNVYPFAQDGMTLGLAAIHVPVALWLVLGLLYAPTAARSDRARMDFVRFTGEWFVYYALLGLGGAVLIGLGSAVFGAIGVDVQWFMVEWVLPCGAAGAVVIAAWLVDEKQSVIENIAPVLTRVFTPLFTAMLLALIVAAVVQRDLIQSDRELLIVFDVVLIVVLGLLLYSISARDAARPPGWFERLQLGLVGSAIVVDLLVLVAMLGRIGAFGFSANKVASLGLNLILLANLLGSAYLLVRFLRDKRGFDRLERWQTGFLPVYLAWAALVVIVIPPCSRSCDARSRRQGFGMMTSSCRYHRGSGRCTKSRRTSSKGWRIRSASGSSSCSRRRPSAASQTCSRRRASRHPISRSTSRCCGGTASWSPNGARATSTTDCPTPPSPTC